MLGWVRLGYPGWADRCSYTDPYLGKREALNLSALLYCLRPALPLLLALPVLRQIGRSQRVGPPIKITKISMPYLGAKSPCVPSP